MAENHICLAADKHIFTGVGADMRYNKPKHEFPMHDHEFHEIVLVTNGCANHYINGSVHPMNTGYLYFIRNTDVHTYSDFIGETFEYYALLFDTDVIKEMRSFFGESLIKDSIFTSPLPPEVHLTSEKTEKLSSSFSAVFLLMHSDVQRFKTESRLLASELFSKHFNATHTGKSDIPLWLEYACRKMQLPKNFTAGSERFFEICGRGREHCTRMMKKHYGISPNDYVSDLRMKYAANLLVSSDLTVSETAIECGYASVPHFYDLFTRRFGVSPKEYRRRSKRIE